MSTSKQDLILLPAGMLPPGEWAVGAVGMYDEGPAVVVARDGGTVCLHEFQPWEPQKRPADLFRIDITAGPLDHATRALWHALGLGEQPLTAPGWARGARGWVLLSRVETASAKFMDGGKWGLDAPGIDGERDPRRALQLACEAVRAERGR